MNLYKNEQISREKIFNLNLEQLKQQKQQQQHA